MNRVLALGFAASFAAVHFASAQGDQAAQPAPANAPAVRRSAAPPRHIAPPQAQRPNVQRQGGGLRAPQFQRFGTPRLNPGFGQRPNFAPRNLNPNNGSANRAVPRLTPVVPPTAGQAAEQNVPVTPVNPNSAGNWRTRIGTGTVDGGSSRVRDTANRDWRNRTGRTGELNTGTAPDRRWNGRTGGSRDWSNRSGGDNNWHHNHSRHDRNWWRSRYNRFERFGGGYYYLDAGFWYPAYGYDSYYSTYAYDAPIYSYNDLSPEQVMSNVQAELARRGYYYGAIDGTYGQQTREALLRYQEENGLAVTGMVDQPTLESLGFE